MTATTKLNSLEALKSINFSQPPALTHTGDTRARKPKQGYNYVRVVPVFTRKLSEKLGQKATAELLGCTAPTIGAGLSANAIYKPIELAASGLWKTEHEPKASAERVPLSKDERLVVLRLTSNDLKAIEPWLTDNGVSFSVLS